MDTDVAVAGAAPGYPARRWGAFADPAVEADFRAWRRAAILPLGRVTMLVCMVGWFVAPPALRLQAGIALPDAEYAICLATGAFLALELPLLRLASVGRTIVPLAVLNLCVTAGSLYWAILLPRPSPVIGVIGGALLMAMIATFLRLPVAAAALCAAGFSGVAAWIVLIGPQRPDLGPFERAAYGNILFFGSFVTVCLTASVQRGLRRQFAAERQVASQQALLAESNRLIRKYVPGAVAARIETGKSLEVSAPRRLRATALSSDVAGFTQLADRLDPESLSQVINEYVAAMTGILEAEGGIVTEFAGDGLMAVFGAPDETAPEVQVERALDAAARMHERLAELSQGWFRLGIDQPLRVRIGINTGMLSVGTFGSDGRATYTAIGLQMNIAARVQAQCEPGTTLLSKTSWALVNDHAEFRPLGEVSVKGVHFPIAVYQPV